MFQHILIATDGSLLSQSALDKAMDFAREAGARVTVMTATEPFNAFSADSAQIALTKANYEEHVRAQAAKHLAEAERKAKSLGVRCTVLQIEQQQPYRAILEIAKQQGCDLIAMASHGRRGVSALILGSETAKVLTHTSIPVLVYR